jgi:hypothetical protein
LPRKTRPSSSARIACILAPGEWILQILSGIAASAKHGTQRWCGNLAD